MKKRIISLLSLLVFTLLMLASCKLPSFLPWGNGQGGTDTPDNGGTTDGKEPENLIYNATSELYIIADQTVEGDRVLEITNKLDEQRTEPSLLASSDSEAHAHEIVIGNTGRPVSKTATDRMNRIEKVTDDEVNFLIYSDGSSVAIVWDEDEDGVARDAAIEYFKSNYISEELISPSKVLHSNTINLLDYYTEKDESYKSALWTEFEKKYGAELTSAYRKLYAIYTDDVIIWLANLYDSDICVCVDLYGEEECSGTKYCGTGGFYYSNSARDTMGYLPDAESTNQALNFLYGTGLATNRGTSYLSVITDEMKEQIGDFIYALEEPNGYFYHPQWGIEFTDTKISRRARDLNWCCNILSTIGRLPKYTTASGMQGEDVAGVSAPLTERLGQSTVLSVSRVISISDDAYAPQLQSLESFKSYLAGLDLRNRSYYVGNEITSQTAQIKARDKQIGTEEDPTPLMSYLIEWLNAGQNPETGTWDWKKPGDAGYENYYGTNGLLKISGIYEEHGVVIPHSKEAAHSAMADIVNPAPIGAVVDLYNTWYGIQNIISILQKYGGEEGVAEANEILAELRADAPNAVIISRNKISEFLKPDGSASYTKNYSAATSQGCPAAVPNSVEGDVNATTIGVSSIISRSLAALGMSEDRIPLFGEAQRYLFRKEIANLSPVNKDGNVSDPEMLDFDYDDIGVESPDLQIEHNGGQGTAFVIADPTGSNKGNVVEMVSLPGAGDSVKLPLQNSTAPNATYILEGDFYLNSCHSNYPVQIQLGGCYMFTLRVKGNDVELWESSSGNSTMSVDEYLGVTVPMQSWFRVRVEYYQGDHDSVRIKFYCDTDLTDDEGVKLYAVSDNYYDSNGEKITAGVGTPSTSFSNANIYIMSSENAKMYVDNLNFYRTRLGYSEVTDPNNQPYFNIDAPTEERTTYDFEDGKLHQDITASVKNEEVKVSGGKLSVSGSADISRLSIPITVRDKGARCGFASLKLNCIDASAGDHILTLTGADADKMMFSLKLICAEDSKGRYLTIKPAGNADGVNIERVRIPLGEEAVISFEYYHAEDILLIYVNGDFVGTSTVFYDGAVKFTMDSLVIESTAGKSFSLTLDDIIVEKTAALFNDAVAPNAPEKLFDFSNSDPEVVITGSGTSVFGGALQMASKDQSKNSVTIPVNNRANISNYVLVSFSLKYNSIAQKGSSHILRLHDKSGNTIVSFELAAEGGKVRLYEMGHGGRVANPIATFDKTAVSLKFEIFFDQRMIYIYNDGTIKAKSSIFAGSEYLEAGFAKLSFESSDAGTDISLDDLRYETLYSIYKNVSIQGTVNSENDLKSGITFESSNTGSMPSAILNQLKGSNFVSIQNLFNTVINKYSNVFALTKNSQGNDEVRISAANINTGASCVTFEADMMLDLTSSDVAYRIYLGQSGRTGTAYYLNMGVSGGKIFLQDVSNASSGDNIKNTVSTDVAVGEWFNLRIEYYTGTRDSVRTKIFINGECVGISKNFADRHNSSSSPASSFSCAEFYFMGAARGTVFMDNIKLFSSDATCTEDVTMKSE